MLSDADLEACLSDDSDKPDPSIQTNKELLKLSEGLYKLLTDFLIVGRDQGTVLLIARMLGHVHGKI